MIISHAYRFIFIKTVKTAGTSVEIALSKFCGPDDVITPITPEDEDQRAKLGYRGPQNFRIPVQTYSFKDWILTASTLKGRSFYNHTGARAIRSHVGNATWNAYFKFTFERNPWDKVVSWYYWNHPKEPRPTISEFVQAGKADKIKGIELYTIDDRIAVDRICFFENLNQEMEAIAQIVGLPENPVLPFAKSGYRSDRRSYREILTDRDRERIARVYAREISLFSYTW